MNNSTYKIKRQLNIIKWDELLFGILFQLIISILIVIAIALYAADGGREAKKLSSIPDEIDTGILVFKSSDLKNADGDWREIIDIFSDHYKASSLSKAKVLIYFDDSSFLTTSGEFRPFLKDFPFEELGEFSNLSDACLLLKDTQKGILISFTDLSDRISFMCNSSTNYFAVLKAVLGNNTSIRNLIEDIIISTLTI